MAQAAQKHDLLLVGSVPLETAEEVLESCGRTLGNYLNYLPDGEVGDRILWVPMLAYRVFHGHPDVETLARPPRVDGVETWKPREVKEVWQFKVKDGVNDVRFGDAGWRLGYARDAINSYSIFRMLRDRGVLPKHLRFQVSLPLTNSAIDVFFHNPADYPRIKPGFEQAMRDEIAVITRKIPPEDLAIQWDCCVEVMDLEDSFTWTPKDNKLERNLDPVSALSPHIPTATALGYHLCYGTLGGWPMVEPKNLSMTVKFANGAVARSGRRVDFIHIPILDTEDESYFAPLRELDVGDTKIYFGTIHDLGRSDSFKRRLEILRKYVPEFGLAAPCGLGRHKPDEVPALLNEHIEALHSLTNGLNA
jgi:hypothetical protein